ncbi:MAG TPA: ATPase, T2SS/T4P/T4SS family [Mycobacteriales bacterium]
MALTQQADAVSLVEDEVRELVRRRGLDPVAQPDVVRRLVEDVIADYEDRSLSGPLPSLGERREVGRHVYDAVAGFGPLQRYLDDSEVEELWINEPGRVFVARRGQSELTTAILTAQQVADLVERMLKTSGRRLDVSSPFVDARLPDGSRLHVVNSEVTGRHLAVNVRKFVLAVNSLDELVRLDSITPAAARFLEASIVTGLNVVVAGGTQAGSETLRWKYVGKCRRPWAGYDRGRANGCRHATT